MTAVMEREEATAVKKPAKEAPRSPRGAPDQPVAIYEVHLPSWRRVPEEQNRSLTAGEIAPKLADYLQQTHFTHVEILGAADTPAEDLKFLIDYMRGRGLEVILDHEPLRFSDYDYQWDTGWAEETVSFFAAEPRQRGSRQWELTNRDNYAFNANYILPLSHDLVMRPRPSLLSLMPGDDWQEFANLRLLFAYAYLLPGKKLVFMGDEFGQRSPWRPETSLDWHLVDERSLHGKLRNWVANLNGFYATQPALYTTDSKPVGFQWVDTSDTSGIVSFLRKTSDGREALLAAFNFTATPRYNYRIGVPAGGFWMEALNSDATEFGGSGQGNLGGVEAAPFGWNFLSHSLMLTLPPLGCVVLKSSNNDRRH